MLFDPIRQKFVPDTPEEKVRQALLQQMLGVLSFPKGLIAVEKMIKGSSFRRADIVAYRKERETLIPLILIECKADVVDEATFAQAAGYNSFVAAPFLCLAHRGGIRTYWKEESSLRSVPFLPPYSQLAARCI